MAEPRFREHIPLMIGGSGEKKTIPLAARHFDHLNVIAGFDQLAGKVAVAKRCCEDIGRDPATLETSVLITAMVDDNMTVDQIPADAVAAGGRRQCGCDRRADPDARCWTRVSAE